jgi:hypothetical protein
MRGGLASCEPEAIWGGRRLVERAGLELEHPCERDCDGLVVVLDPPAFLCCSVMMPNGLLLGLSDR